MSKESNKNWFKPFLPIVGVILSVLAFFSGGFQVWVTISAVVVGVLLVLTWLFSEVGWLGKAIRFRWFRSKLSKEQAIRLSVLLDDISNQMSYSYTLSPFYVWRNCSNNYPKYLRFNDSYYGGVSFWLYDLKEKFNDPSVKNLILLSSLSKAVSETTKLAEYAENKLEELLRNKDLTDQERASILKEWDSAKNHFNHWINNWRNLFREINKTTNVNCIEYFRSLEMIV